MIIVDGRRPAMSDEASEKRGRLRSRGGEEVNFVLFGCYFLSSSGREERHAGGMKVV